MYKFKRARRKSAQTDYRKRVALLKGRMPRVVVRKSNREITMQVVEFMPDGDKVVASVSSKALRAFGWEPRCNIPTAYLTGLLLSSHVKNKDEKYVLDIGLYRPIRNSVIFAAAKGAIDAGMGISSGMEFDESRLEGKHIEAYASSTHSPVQFAELKKKVDPSKIASLFGETKKKILNQ
ncbi:MAG: 50S ribosomal protein L18 [Candidatus Marsarchaeota archaeon]|jgi:large subunit ribosomal protein L18|nr:50S ribosomal protein L18 [Candidatus Marsarchaeota archaeon]MCL5112788.1 50S ribosomal protein L18 [Candidatus Marsarchaeota archaeon]